MTEHEMFERAAILRRGLAIYLGIEDDEPPGVGIMLGATGGLLVTMPLEMIERLLRDASVMRNARQARDEMRESREPKFGCDHAVTIGETLLGLVGREVTLAVPPLPPVAGYVYRVTIGHALDERPFVILATDRQGDVEFFLDTIESVSV
jgi:hypothetical protein